MPRSGDGQGETGRAGGSLRALVKIHSDPFALIDTPLFYLRDGQVLATKLHASGFNLREIQNVADQCEQVPSPRY